MLGRGGGLVLDRWWGLCGVVKIIRDDLYKSKKSQNDLFTLNTTRRKRR